jgi:DNA-directed RNA polymerase specialized sigma24 family protein
MLEADLEVLAARAASVVDRVLASQRGPAMRPEDVEDIRSSVMLRLLLRLRRDAGSISNLETYAVAATHNAINDHLRRRYPERARLKNRLRYLMTRDETFALWSGDAGILCGFRKWSGSPTAGTAPRIEELPSSVLAKRDERSAAKAMFLCAGTALLLDEVVAMLVEAWQVREAGAADPDHLPDHGADAASALDRRQELATLWREIGLLPRAQRVALLLNLRDAEGANAVALIVFLAIATLDDIASVLDLTTEHLAELWSRLPLDDQSIATVLGVTRQQVINLRGAARRRLVRRMAADAPRRS